MSKVLINFIKGLRHRAYIAFYRMLPLKRNKIICWSNNLKSYGCNPKYLTEYLAENFPNEFDIVWVFNEDAEIPQALPAGVRVVRYFSLDYLRELHTAKFIVTNARIAKSLYFHKRRGQFYIQTWHSSLRLKKIEGDAELPQSYVENAMADSANIDMLISGCKFSTEIFKNAFWYNGRILECGTPRCDMFFKNDGVAEAAVRAEYGIADDVKIALYAPTFRKGYAENDLGIDYKRLKTALEKRFGGEFCLLYRFHPNVKPTASGKACQWLKNATRYHDMQQLIKASSVLITDYSSCMFDAAVAGKPCFLFAPDLAEYEKNERGLYFDIKKLPFAISLSNDELEGEIVKFDTQGYNAASAEFLKETGSFEDGNACRRIAEEIKKQLQ